MRCLKMVDGDVVRVDGAAVVLTGADALKQRIQHRLALMLGEWHVDVTKGMDWLNILRNKNASDRAKSEVKRVLLEDTEITNVSDISIIALDRASRHFKLSFTAKSIYGNISMGVES